MSVQDSPAIKVHLYTGAGNYDVPFTILNPQDVIAYIVRMDGSIVYLSYGVEYTVAIPEYGAGAVVTLLEGVPPPPGRITFKREMPYDQVVDWLNGSALDMPLFTKSMDKLTMLLQQLRDEASGLFAQTNWMGYWSAAIQYGLRDIVIDGYGGNWYQCLEAHTSVSFAEDVADGKWFMVYDASEIRNAVQSCLVNSTKAETEATSAEEASYAAIGAAATAQAAAVTALTAPGTAGHSTTSLLIGLGAKTLTIEPGKLFVGGMGVSIASAAGPTTLMHGIITAYDSVTGEMDVEVGYTSGSGTFADWLVTLSSVGFGINLRIGVPAGTILPFVGGYFTNSVNGGYVAVFGTTNAEINNHIAEDGFRVCDGSQLQIAGSPIFGAAGRYLPNLSDDRFLMGAATVGAIGGASVSPEHAHTYTHTHYMDHYHYLYMPAFMSGYTSLAVDQLPAHFHYVRESYGNFDGLSSGWALDSGWPSSIRQGGYAQVGATEYAGSGNAHGHYMAAMGFNTNGASTAYTGNPTASYTSNAGSVENRPKFLSCKYIMKVL